MYTLRTAAKATGISRATIHRAIQSGKISARRKEDGFFEIDPAELHRVYAPVSFSASRSPIAKPAGATPPAQARPPVEEDAVLSVENARLEAEIAGLKALLQVHRDQVDDLRTERDRLIGTVEGAQRLLTHEKSRSEERRSGWLWGRRSA
jgi:hypothetical protein